MPIIKEPVVLASEVIIRRLEELDKQNATFTDTIVVLPDLRVDKIGTLSAFRFWNMNQDRYVIISLDRNSRNLSVYKLENEIETCILHTGELFSRESIKNGNYASDAIKIAKVIFDYLSDK